MKSSTCYMKQIMTHIALLLAIKVHMLGLAGGTTRLLDALLVMEV
jgi:hypothetical protein